MLTVGSIVIRSLDVQLVHRPKRPPDADCLIIEHRDGNRLCVVDASPGEAA